MGPMDNKVKASLLQLQLLIPTSSFFSAYLFCIGDLRYLFQEKVYFASQDRALLIMPH